MRVAGEGIVNNDAVNLSLRITCPGNHSQPLMPPSSTKAMTAEPPRPLMPPHARHPDVINSPTLDMISRDTAIVAAITSAC